MRPSREQSVDRPVPRSNALSVLLAIVAVVVPFTALLGKHPSLSALAVSGMPLALVAGLLGRRQPTR